MSMTDNLRPALRFRCAPGLSLASHGRHAQAAEKVAQQIRFDFGVGTR